MADYDSSLPIRTETDGDAVVKIVDGAGSNIAEVNVKKEQLVKDTDVETALGNIETNQTDKTQLTQITDGTEELEVNPDGSINVNVVDSAVGDEVHKYGTVVAGVPGTPNTVVDYTVNVGHTLLLKSIQASASGKFKVELKAGTPTTETTRAVAFGSTSSGLVQIVFPTPIEISASDKVLLIITNNDKANADVYGFINGMEV